MTYIISLEKQNAELQERLAEAQAEAELCKELKQIFEQVTESMDITLIGTTKATIGNSYVLPISRNMHQYLIQVYEQHKAEKIRKNKAMFDSYARLQEGFNKLTNYTYDGDDN
jgi:6-pyruvoyl-tetrahydropterin synthase